MGARRSPAILNASGILFENRNTHVVELCVSLVAHVDPEIAPGFQIAGKRFEDRLAAHEPGNQFFLNIHFEFYIRLHAPVGPVPEDKSFATSAPQVSICNGF